jgi:transposase-like protein
MYSQAQKDDAVEHYLEHGRCIAVTIRALGYPSRDLLAAWIEQVHPQGRARVAGQVPELAPEAKQSAVIALCLRPASAQAVADDVGAYSTPSRTPFRTDGGQRSNLIADTWRVS